MDVVVWKRDEEINLAKGLCRTLAMIRGLNSTLKSMGMYGRFLNGRMISSVSFYR